jgi:hypothetical protein
MAPNPRSFIGSAEIGQLSALEAAEADAGPPLDLDKLPPGVVSGPTLIDFSGAPAQEVRAGVSLSMLFASRVANHAAKVNGGDEDDWLASYTSSLSNLGFALSGTAMVKSSFKKIGVEVHKAIIPFLTVALGGAAIGPIILAALQNLQSIDEGKPWIQLFEREARRFDVRELHFAAATSTPSDTQIRYAIARLGVDASVASILFFKVSQASAEFESAATTLSANSSLMAAIEPDLRQRLGQMSQKFIAVADIGIAG